jgi:hypothetical protein
MPLATKLVSGYLYAFQNTVRLFVICNVVELYPETDSILDICNVYVLETHRMYLR